MQHTESTVSSVEIVGNVYYFITIFPYFAEYSSYTALP